VPAPSTLKQTWAIRLFALRHIPLIALIRPTIVQADTERCVVRVPLGWLVKNHLGTMYFGALCIGADLAGGLVIMNMIRARRSRVAFLFKDFQADFLKRAEGPVVFTCPDGAAMGALLDEAERTGERVEGPVRVTATVPSKLGDEPVAEFVLTLSMKKR
jgi:acyl-coenzyme A thioesterase PaaI-like protein